MPSGKPGHGSKRPTDAQPQNEILRSWGLGGYPQQAAPEAEWLSRGIACRYYPELRMISDNYPSLIIIFYFIMMADTSV